MPFRRTCTWPEAVVGCELPDLKRSNRPCVRGQARNRGFSQSHGVRLLCRDILAKTVPDRATSVLPASEAPHAEEAGAVLSQRVVKWVFSRSASP